MDLRDNEMNRSLTQALYKYLPDSWIDFYIKKSGTAYTAKVTNWNSGELQYINVARLLEQIRINLKSFEDAGGQLSGFGNEIDEQHFKVLTPKLGINADVIAEVSPLTFFCSECMNVERVSSSESINKSVSRISKCCKKNLKQIRLIYSCECGWAGPVEPKQCSNNHGFDKIKFTGKFTYVCKVCNKEIQMNKICPTCGKYLNPKNALDQSHYIPHSFSTIDLYCSKDEGEDQFLEKEELFLQNEKDGAKIIIAKWLAQISDLDYRNFIINGISKEEDEGKQLLYERTVEQFKTAGMPIEQAKEYARMAAFGSENTLLDEINSFISTIEIKNETKIYKVASNLLEYYKVLNDSNVSTLEDAKEISKKLNTNANPEEYSTIAERFGVKNAQACGNVPFVFCSYGYTRKCSDPNEVSKDANHKLTLRSFPQEFSDKKNIYGSKLRTEGVLFEFDKKKIIQWIVKNKFIEENKLKLPINIDDEMELKRWFINNIDTDAIPTFNAINKNENAITFYVYNLLHSMSHALIKEAAQLCGLDKNSLSEYIFPNIPAVFIYCQNSQGFSLGALFNLFQAYFDRWLKLMSTDIEKCVFDPICIDRDRACAGCLYLNEISCVHFNKDLDRRFLIGHYDKTTEERIYGFWEGALNGYNVSE